MPPIPSTSYNSVVNLAPMIRDTPSDLSTLRRLFILEHCLSAFLIEHCACDFAQSGGDFVLRSTDGTNISEYSNPVYYATFNEMMTAALKRYRE